MGSSAFMICTVRSITFAVNYDLECVKCWPIATNHTIELAACAGVRGGLAHRDRRYNITLTVALGRLREALKLPVHSPDEPTTHVIVVPVRITKRGIEQKLIIGDGIMAPVPRDEPLVKAVARAFSWFEDICMRRVNDLSELAVREQLTWSYVQAHLPLAFLAPSIVVAILEGGQPADLSLKQLMCRTDLADSWTTQRQQLGFET